MTFPAPRGLKARIIAQLRRQPATLADLQAAVGASRPTLRRAVEELADARWICAAGQTASTGGRPATRYGLDPTRYLLIGAEIAIPAVNVVVTTLDGQVIEETRSTSADAASPEDAVALTARLVADARARQPQRRFLGLGVTIPGYVDAANGSVLYIGRAPGWQAYPLRSRLEAAIGLPVVMGNDTDCLLRAELEQPRPPAGDALYLAVLEGVKLSMMLGGRVHEGPFGNAGLIGRMRLRPVSGADRSADLEQTASVGAVCRAFDGAWQDAGAPPALAALAALDDHATKFAAILREAAEGEPLCAGLVDAMLGQLALAAANVIFILQPRTLIIGGQLSGLPEPLRRRFEAELRDFLPPLLRHHLIVQYPAVTGRYAAALGAAHWCLKWLIAADGLFDGSPEAALERSP